IQESYRLFNKSIEHTTEYDGETLGDYLQRLIATKDQRILPLLIDVMVSKHVGGRMITEGLWELGTSAKLAMIDSLESTCLYTQVRAANTLGEITDMDSTDTYLTEKEREYILNFSIKTLNSIIDNDDSLHLKGSLINTLSFLGDSSTIPLLHAIATTDTVTTATGRFAYRRIATRAIERIKARE
ncbi:hypothetical protein ACFL47_11270, partial [Candidatus Latescibacterota bacterium]